MKSKHLFAGLCLLAAACIGSAQAQSPIEVDPQSIALNLAQGEATETQVSITINPFCFTPYNLEVVASIPEAQVTNLSGVQQNGCGGDETSFNVQITGTGGAQSFDLQFVDANFAATVASIPVTINGGNNAFATVNPTSIDLLLDQGETLSQAVSIQINPLCVRPFDIDVIASIPGAQIVNQTGILENLCGGDTSNFTIDFTGTGAAQSFLLQFVDSEFGGDLASIPVTITPRTPRACDLGLSLGMRADTLNVGLAVESIEPANLNIYFALYDDVYAQLPAPLALPAVDPAQRISVPIPDIPDIGTIGVLVTMTTAEDGIICSAWDTVDTGSGRR